MYSPHSRLRIVRIRRCSAIEGGRNLYYHADVLAPNWSAAMKAAREGRVHNWRFIDSFDRASETYKFFMVLNTNVEPRLSEQACAPKPAKPGQTWTSPPNSVTREPGYRYCCFLPKKLVRRKTVKPS